MSASDVLATLSESSSDAEIVSALLDVFFSDEGVRGAGVLAQVESTLGKCRPEEVRARNPKLTQEQLDEQARQDLEASSYDPQPNAQPEASESESSESQS